MKTFIALVLALGMPLMASLPALAVESETVKGAAKDYQTFKADMAVKLGDLDKKLDELRSKAKKTGNQTQDQAIHDLETARAQLQNQLNTKMNDAQEATQKSWKDFKDSFAKSVNHLNTKIQTALKD